MNVSNISEEQLLAKLDDVAEQICGPNNKCLEILQNINFDTLYSTLYELEKVSVKVQQHLINLLQTSFRRLRDYIRAKHLIDSAKDIYITQRIVNEIENGMYDKKPF